MSHRLGGGQTRTIPGRPWTAAPIWNEQVPFDTAAIGPARRAAVQVLRDHGVTADLDSFEIVFSEILTNAVRHGAAPIYVNVALSAERVTVEIRDGGAELPRRLPADLTRSNGNGLRIVAALSEGWGVDTAKSPGKTVWFRIRLATGAF